MESVGKICLGKYMTHSGMYPYVFALLSTTEIEHHDLSHAPASMSAAALSKAAGDGTKYQIKIDQPDRFVMDVSPRGHAYGITFTGMVSSPSLVLMVRYNPPYGTVRSDATCEPMVKQGQTPKA